ncbi:unnamed protein product [Paramecium sonneborni]|uniref:RNA helicase n=1 Tax=Paramecium sonneborni TaxID=65129 RepID=A0A8S1M759_9CILI|nr:unnamed protein product [Paramecium sonneborni]
MYSNHQNAISLNDDLDPDNLDVEDMVKKRWKQTQGKVVGMINNRLPPFQKQFLDPKKAFNQEMTEATIEFLKKKEIAIKAFDGQKYPHPFLTWESTQFHQQIMFVINKQNFKSPTPIQSVVFPLILSGYDVIGVAETGSGKTFGYLLPGLIQIACQKYPENFRNKINGPEMLILAPTRELVMQITQQVELFVKSYNFKVACAFGGQNRNEQASQIYNNPNILVACPGRLKDFLQEGILELSKVTYLVIDEADRLLDMGFEDDVRFIVERTRLDRQTVFFSATWPKAVRNLSFDFCSEKPIYVQIGRSNLTVNKNIDQEIICLYNNEKLQTLFDILDSLKIHDKVLIFAETRRSCEQLSVDMTNEGYYAVALHGDKSQRQRDEIMKNYKKSETKLLCATDLASRGLDVSDITVVINYDFPKYFDDYIHRIGRTGRAGRRGRAFSFFSIEKDQPQMARELLKFNQVHQIKFNFQMMSDLANGIRQQFRTSNTLQTNSKYNGQILNGSKHDPNELFKVPHLTQEQKANLYLQPHQYEIIQNRNNQNNYGRQNQGRSHYGQQNYRQNQRREDLFYQDKFRNRGQNEQRRNQEQNWKTNRFGQQSDFQGQRREDYLDFGRDRDNGRQGYNQSRFGFQGSDNPRQDNNRWQNNEQDNTKRFQENRRDQFDYNREDKLDQQQKQNPFTQTRFSDQKWDQPLTNQRNERQQPFNNQKEERYQPFPNQREEIQQQSFNNQRDQKQQPYANQREEKQQYSTPQQGFQRDQQDQKYRAQQNYYKDQQFNEQRQQQNQRNFQNDQQRTPYNTFSYQHQEQNPSSRYGYGFDNFQNDRQFDNQRFSNPNKRQQNNWGDRENNQGYPQRQYDQQQQRTSAPDNQWNRNSDQGNKNQRYQQDDRNQRYYQDDRNQRFYQDDINQRYYQDDRNQRFQQDDRQSNQNQRVFNQQNDDQRPNNRRNFVDVSQPEDDKLRKDSAQQPDSTIFPNFNNFEPEENQIQKKDNIQDFNQNLYNNLNTQQNQDQNERSQNQRNYDFRQNDNFNRDEGVSSNTRSLQQQGDQAPYMKQEQQLFKQQFEQKPVQNNFINERFQNQPSRQNDQSQRSLLDQKMDQMPQYLENQRQNNERSNFVNQQQPQNICQSFNRNERVQDDQDNDQMDFNRYSKEMDELEQAPKLNQQERKNSRKNSDQQQNQNLQQNQLDSQDQY